MFGITNDCNLSCGFCSRDLGAPGHWTAESAFEVLRDLGRAGVLEVAFGGGEPFAFPRFEELIDRLYRETSLALNVTTNGTLLDAETWARFAGRLGQVRVSLYGDKAWVRCAELFQATGQQWGANVLVDDEALLGLPATLKALQAAGCHDVSLLNFVGEPDRVLSATGRRELRAIVEESPIPCRLSVCLGDSLGLPRLMAGPMNDGDCGAGKDFLTVTPDQRVQACSFQQKGVLARSATEILRAWRSRHSMLSSAAQQSGCARLEQPVAAGTPLPEVAVWQGFSGNNSGDCILVAKFENVDDAQAYLETLLPGWTPSEDTGYSELPYSDVWKALFTEERVARPVEALEYGEPPDDLVQIGRAVLATGYGIEDNFPELRALAWKRRAFVLPGGIHVHESSRLVAVIRTSPGEDPGEIVDAAAAESLVARIHGEHVILCFPPLNDAPELRGCKSILLALAGGRPLSAELYSDPWDAEALTRALKHLGDPIALRGRLWIQGAGSLTAAEAKRRFGEAPYAVGKDWVLFDPVGRGRTRLALLAYRAEAQAVATTAERVHVFGYLYDKAPPRQKGKRAARKPVPRPEVLRQKLEAVSVTYGRALIEVTEDYNNATTIQLASDQPGAFRLALESLASDLGLSLFSRVMDPEPLDMLLRRLLEDVRSRPH